MDTKEKNQSKESLSAYSFLVMDDMKSNKYFASLYVGEPN